MKLLIALAVLVGSCAAQDGGCKDLPLSAEARRYFGIAECEELEVDCIMDSRAERWCQCHCGRVRKGLAKGRQRTAVSDSPRTAAPPPANDMACFSAEDFVRTESGAPMTMRELAAAAGTGLSVAGPGGPSPLRYWLHLDPARRQDFLELVLGNGIRLSITAEHLIYTVPCEGPGAGGPLEEKFAARVRPGECLLTQSPRGPAPVPVTAIGHVTRVGIYAPVTRGGKMFVNDVLVSCFSGREDAWLLQYLFDGVHALKTAAASLIPAAVTETLLGAADMTPVIEALFAMRDFFFASS